MGCNCGGSSQKYKYDGKDRVIPRKEALTLSKYGMRTVARIKVRKMKIDCAKKIAYLNKPTAMRG